MQLVLERKLFSKNLWNFLYNRGNLKSVFDPVLKAICRVKVGSLIVSLSIEVGLVLVGTSGFDCKFKDYK